MAIFDAYGLEVLRVPPQLPEEWHATLLKVSNVKETFSDSQPQLVALGLLREETALLRPFSLSQRASMTHGSHCIHRSTLAAFSLPRAKQQLSTESKELDKKLFQHDTPGHIDLSLRSSSGDASSSSSSSRSGVFGWDDIFVVQSSGMSYEQLKQFGLKRSSRDQVVSHYLKNTVYYEKLLNLEFNPVDAKRAVDFAVDPAVFVQQNKHFNNPLSIAYGFRNLLTHVLNFGVYFRSASNRVLNNYWNPGVNGGIPLVKKRDEIHEITFMAHDFGHFLIPDLTYIGNNSLLHRRCYIAWRMISEATTMALADMLFIDALKQSGVEYDFTSRKIYPLFCDLQLSFKNKDEFMKNLKQVIRANYLYCLMGDDSLYQQLIREASASTSHPLLPAPSASASASSSSTASSAPVTASASIPVASTIDTGAHPATSSSSSSSSPCFKNLDKFKDKFMPFFVEDFKWTEHNYNNMLGRADEMRLWWEMIKPLRELPGSLGMKSIDDFIGEMKEKHPEVFTAACTGSRGSGEDFRPLIDAIFERVFEDRIAPAFDPTLSASTSLLPAELRLQRAFNRYMAGQCAIFAKFAFVPESSVFLRRIVDMLLAGYQPVDEKEEEEKQKTKTKLSAKGITLQTIDQVRAEYETFLQLLLSKSLISGDELETFKELYPLFDPHYMCYDKDLTRYEPLDVISRRVFSASAHRQDQLQLVARALGRKVTEFSKSERSFLERMSKLVEESGGQIDDGIFVTKPGVALISGLSSSSSSDVEALDPEIESQGLATFLLAGISIETSLELVAHKEARVARLTSSKTKAMDLPLFRVQSGGVSGRVHKRYILEVLSSRAHFERTHHPRVQTANGTLAHGFGHLSAQLLPADQEQVANEIWNITAPGSKCTALCYTMALRDFHSLFVGRIPFSGNENEMRHICWEMALQLHQRYPQHIHHPSAYLDPTMLSSKFVCASDANTTSASTAASEHKQAEDSDKVAARITARVELTANGSSILKTMNICGSPLPEYLQLTEFRSRITYLAFVDTQMAMAAAASEANAAKSEAYCRKVVHELQHRSILAAHQLAYSIYGLPLSLARSFAFLFHRFGVSPTISCPPASSTIAAAGAATVHIILPIKDTQPVLKAARADVARLGLSPADSDKLLLAYSCLAAEANKECPVAVFHPSVYGL